MTEDTKFKLSDSLKKLANVLRDTNLNKNTDGNLVKVASSFYVNIDKLRKLRDEGKRK